MRVHHSDKICDSDEEMDGSPYVKENSFKKELFNKTTSENLSISFDGSQLEIAKNELKNKPLRLITYPFCDPEKGGVVKWVQVDLSHLKCAIKLRLGYSLGNLPGSEFKKINKAIQLVH